MVTAAAFLAVAWLFFESYDPFAPAGPDLAEARSFACAPAGVASLGNERPPCSLDSRWSSWGHVRWSSSGGYGGGSAISIEGKDREGGGALVFTIAEPKRAAYYRVGARVRTENFRAGPRAWDGVVIELFFRDASGTIRWDVPHMVCEERRTIGWFDCSKVIAVPEFAATGTVYACNGAESGAMWIDDLEVVPIVASPWLPYWRGLFALTWAAMFAWSARALRLGSTRQRLAVLTLAIVITLGVGAPEPLITTPVTWVGARLRETNRPLPAVAPKPPVTSAPGQPTPRPVPEPATKTENPAPAPVPVRPNVSLVLLVKKLGHFVLFVTLAAFSTRCVRPLARRRVLELVAGLLLFAAATEVLQMLTDTRTASLFDFLIDAAGAGIGVLIVAAASSLHAHGQERAGSSIPDES